MSDVRYIGILGVVLHVHAQGHVTW